ncbi:MAG: hypothetical protein K6F46_06705 [Desulfovibrio sp.]|nr:hypothetical protein [Desulfovibrio sp.]
MSISHEGLDLAEKLLRIFSNLPNGLTDKDVNVIRQMASDEGPAEVWLQTSTLSKETRIGLIAAAAYILRSLNNDAYKCSLFSLHAAKLFIEIKKTGL